jgi:hypothetical protein
MMTRRVRSDPLNLTAYSISIMSMYSSGGEISHLQVLVLMLGISQTVGTHSLVWCTSGIRDSAWSSPRIRAVFSTSNIVGYGAPPTSCLLSQAPAVSHFSWRMHAPQIAPFSLSALAWAETGLILINDRTR